jgi:uncharacterized radical SAM superfamily protein
LNNMQDLDELVQEAWTIRKKHAPTIWLSVPGAKHYANRYYANRRDSFVNLSVTGAACACRCAHCEGKLLQTMLPVTAPSAMMRAVDSLAEKGCRGILVSGGADCHGEVPLLQFAEAIAYARSKGLRVLVHSGLITRETAMALHEAGVDQVLMDVIGHEDTIREVYHLNLTPRDYLDSMMACREAGLAIAPHIVIGLHFGHILGEPRALEMIRQAEPQALVLVILTPTIGTAMAKVKPPPVDQVTRIIATARIQNSHTPLTMGCARPPGPYKRRVEMMAVDCGINAIAYPDESTIGHAHKRGLEPVFTEMCCSLASVVMEIWSRKE